MNIPDWPTFVQTIIASGAFVLLVVNFLVTYLPVPWKDYVKNAAVYIVPLLSYFAPTIAVWLLKEIPAVDPWLWTGLYALATYAVHEFLYRIGQKRLLRS